MDAAPDMPQRAHLAPTVPDLNAERIRLLYRQGTPTVLIGFGAAVVLVAVLWSEIDHRWLITWGTVLGLVTLLRVALVMAFHRSRAPQPQRWETYYVISTVV